MKNSAIRLALATAFDRFAVSIECNGFGIGHLDG